MDRVTCNIKIDDIEKNVLLITPFHKKGFDENSVYEFKLPDIKSVNGTILKAHKIKYITRPSIMYATIEDIRNRLGDIDISDEIILYQIKESSRLIEIIVQRAYEKQNVKFSKEDLLELRNNIEQLKDEHTLVWHFVVFKACYECLSTLYITMATRPEKVKEVLSDLTKEVNFNLNALKKLLDDYKKKLDEILNQVLTFADPVFAVRGRTAVAVNIDLGAPYYKINGMGGYNRSYNSFGYNRGGR